MYSNELRSLTDKELMLLKYMEIEMQNKNIKAINAELNRRNKEE